MPKKRTDRKDRPITGVTFEGLSELKDLIDRERGKVDRNALEDPDNPPLAESDFQRLKVKRVKRG